ncbi:hypothetical protein JCM5296_006114 [Sporobolomyces johnsonii]
MFKFWKSPKTSPNPQTSPNPAQTPPASSNSPRVSPEAPSTNGAKSSSAPPLAPPVPPTTGNVGLGLSVPVLQPSTTANSSNDRRVRYPDTSNETEKLAVPSTGEDRFPAGGERRREGRRSSSSGVGERRSSYGGGAKGGRPSWSSGGGDASDSQAQNGRASPMFPTLGAQRTVSPMSFSPSFASTFHSPYGASTPAFSDRDPSQIYAPTTWSDMAHQELVVNVSARERTRQEILWEVVASEERYVAELRSLVDQYANPLLHPLLSSSPPLSSPPLGSTSPPLAQGPARANASTQDLPIAARFLRSTTSSISRNPAVHDHIPEIESSEAPRPSQSTQGRGSISTLPRHPADSSTSLDTINANDPAGGVSGRLASFGFRTRHPLRPAPTGAKLQKSTSRAPQEALKAPPLPDALRQVLEATVEMLKGHEELSARLKEQWAKAFPLVRGLAAIWSDQPWFLQTYAAYIVSLEEALATVDSALPSAHSPALSSYAAKFKSPKSKQDKQEKRLAQALMTLEERAAEAGESSLSICLSKPLMRLSKLPLLMQALLYHTDPTTHEWEKTRAMALEVDALVRSIEDEKIEEEQRERTRDVLARIDGINDKALMAPRSARILVDETPANDPPSASHNKSRASRRISSGPSSKPRSTENDWLIRFTDVVIRAQKVGQTNIPGSFSREKEKQGKQGKTRRTGKLRNTYRFVRVERWELREAAEAALVDMNEVGQAQVEGRYPQAEPSESEDDDTLDAESRMSFRYDSDDPQPASPRDFTKPRTKKKPLPAGGGTAKFGGRLRVGSEDAHGHGGLRATTPGGRHRFDQPTVSSTLKAQQQQQQQAQQSQAHPRRAASTPVPAPTRTTLHPPAPNTISHTRDESTYKLYEMWSSTQES